MQWWASEKAHAVVVPRIFWYLSIFGSLIILAYAIHIRDIVFTVAQLLSLFIYARNTFLATPPSRA
ncbi:MAG: lipid-A-disaccharide synthase N-terminal domain-containing protein [Minisyncoccia bacterium]